MCEKIIAVLKQPKRLVAQLEKVIVTAKPEVKEHYLEGKNLIIVLQDNSRLVIDISEYITDERINAINNMVVSIENGELILEYDDEVLNLDFYLENENLIVDNNVDIVDFNINEKGEMEAIINGN